MKASTLIALLQYYVNKNIDVDIVVPDIDCKGKLDDEALHCIYFKHPVTNNPCCYIGKAINIAAFDRTDF